MFENMRRDGLNHPAEKSRPALRGDCIEYLNAFRFLGASRLWNQVGPQRIVPSEMTNWLRLVGHRGEDLLKACRMVGVLDDVEVSNFYDKRKTESK